MIARTINETEVQLLNANFVNDIIKTSIGDVPYEWTTSFTLESIDEAIQNFMNDTPNEVNSNGIGFIVPVGDREVEITDADFIVNYLNFRWRSGYTGDCAIEFEFTEETTAADIVTAIQEII